MRIQLRQVLMLLAVPLLLSCGAAERGKYHGSLYYGQGPYLMQFSLGDVSVTVVNSLGDRTIRAVSALGEDKPLIAETTWIQSKSAPRISWFDLKTGQSAVFYSGMLARHVANAGIIVYDDGSKLYAVPQLGTGSDEILVAHGLNQLSTLTVVSEHSVLFETVDAGQPYAVGNYALAVLAGVVDGALGLPSDKRFLALTYIAGQDAVVLKESWQGILGGQDKSAVWVHDVRTGANHRLARNLNFGSSVVYADF
jgi:hypothetical protein